MSRIHPVQVLLDEHGAIEQVLYALEFGLARLECDPAAPALLDQVLDFLTNFADGCHHEKEEKVLFPLLKRKGLSAAAEAVVDEHRTGRLHLETIKENLGAAARGDLEALGLVRCEGRVYAALMREHIRQENETLFELARQVLTAEDIERLDELFAATGHHQMDEATYEKYQVLGEQLAAVAASSGI